MTRFVALLREKCKAGRTPISATAAQVWDHALRSDPGRARRPPVKGGGCVCAPPGTGGPSRKPCGRSPKHEPDDAALPRPVLSEGGPGLAAVRGLRAIYAQELPDVVIYEGLVRLGPLLDDRRPPERPDLPEGSPLLFGVSQRAGSGPETILLLWRNPRTRIRSLD